MDLFSFHCDLSDVNLSRQDLKDMLPAWKTRILEVKKLSESPSLLEIKFLINAKSVESVKGWIKSYEELTVCSYTIRNSITAKERTISFKQILNCHRNSNYHRKDLKRKTKNTNCPSKMTVKLYTTKPQYRRKDPSRIPDKDMPCEIVLIPTHNHSLNPQEALQFRPVASEVRTKLLDLYKQGHTPSTALESLKMDITLSSEDYPTLLMDRKFCPDYNYCLNLYTKFKKENNLQHTGIVCNELVEKDLKNRTEKQNFVDETDGNNAILISYDPSACITNNFEKDQELTVLEDEFLEVEVEYQELNQQNENIKKFDENLVDKSVKTQPATAENLSEGLEDPKDLRAAEELLREQNIKKGEELLRTITQKLSGFIQEYPDQAVICLEKFNNRTKKLKSKLAFASALSKFGSEIPSRTKIFKYIQNSDVSRRKTIQEAASEDFVNNDLLNVHNYASKIKD